MKISKDRNVFFSSDFHFNHKNIVAGESEWEHSRRCRPFQTLAEHNAVLVKNINDTVGEKDILFFLGDWSFGGIESIWEFRKQINCKEIHLILGNHDHHIESNKPLPNVIVRPDDIHAIDVPKNERSFIHGKWYVSGEGNTTSIGKVYSRNTVMARDLFSSVNHYLEISIDNYRVVLFHFALRVWNKSHHGSIMLYGHSHGTLNEFTPEIANPTWIGDKYYIRNYRTMDVGIDTTPDFTPWSWQDIKSEMATREVGMEVDHHKKENPS